MMRSEKNGEGHGGCEERYRGKVFPTPRRSHRTGCRASGQQQQGLRSTVAGHGSLGSTDGWCPYILFFFELVSLRSFREWKQVRPIEKIESATTLVFILQPKPALFYSFVRFAWLGCSMLYRKGGAL
jgi:hypothetical protein